MESTALTRTTENFGSTELAPIVETAAAAVAASARAKVEARAIMAYKRPRDLDMVRVRLLKECDRPGFAAVARYSVPRGGKSIEGPSIRFAEAMVQTMGNLDVTVDVLFDAPDKRIVKVSVVDLETNASYSTDVTIEKVVERSRLRDGQDSIGTRTNSAGKMVYLIAADEGELLVKQAALISKSLRTSALRLLPGDILEECMARVVATLKKADAADPTAARKGVVDNFMKLGVTPADLKSFLGHDIDSSSPAEMAELRAVYSGIAEGAATWAEIMKERAGERAAEENGAAPKTGGKLDQLKAKLADKAKKKAEAAAPKSEPVVVEAKVESKSTGMHDPDGQPPRDEPGAAG